MINDEKKLTTLYADIADAVKRGMTHQQIIDDLKAHGYPEESAIQITNNAIRMASKARRSDRISTGMAELVVGIPVFGIGLFIMFATFVSGGTYIILIGMLITGGGLIVRGLSKLITPWR